MSSYLYESDWKDLRNAIFDINKQLPDQIFKKEFDFITLLGAINFEQFKSCLQKIGEKSFVILQDAFGMSPHRKRCLIKMKYPTSIEWDELMSKNFISSVLFEAAINDYYIFGESGEWGMYIATEYVNKAVNPAGSPIRIVGFDPKYRAIFRNAFEIPEGEYCENVYYIPEEERPELREWTPEKYRGN